MRALLIAILGVFGFVGSDAMAARVQFDANVTDIVSEDLECDHIFDVTSYTAKHFWTGPTRRTSVMNFRNDELGGALHGLILVGLYGGSGDLFYDEEFNQEETRYSIHAEGFLDFRVMYLEVDVTLLGEDDEAVCSSSAIIAGFN